MLSEDEKAIQFYKRFIEAEEQELEWMYRENEEYYKDTIEQKELLIKGWRNILNLITKLQKENEEKAEQIDLMAEYMEENMDEYQLDEIYEKQYNCNGMERNWTRGKEKEIKDIKQYFERKATNNA